MLVLSKRTDFLLRRCALPDGFIGPAIGLSIPIFATKGDYEDDDVTERKAHKSLESTKAFLTKVEEVCNNGKS